MFCVRFLKFICKMDVLRTICLNCVQKCTFYVQSVHFVYERAQIECKMYDWSTKYATRVQKCTKHVQECTFRVQKKQFFHQFSGERSKFLIVNSTFLCTKAYNLCTKAYNSCTKCIICVRKIEYISYNLCTKCIIRVQTRTVRVQNVQSKYKTWNKSTKLWQPKSCRAYRSYYFKN